MSTERRIILLLYKTIEAIPLRICQISKDIEEIPMNSTKQRQKNENRHVHGIVELK